MPHPPGTAAPAKRLPTFVVTAMVGVLLAAHWWLGLSAQIGKTVAYDELAHLGGGFSYWRYNDYRFQPENGNLPQRLASVPWTLSHARLEPLDTAAWARSDVWLLGHRLLYESGNNTDYLLLWSRATMALVGVALGLLIFMWSRALWGDFGGLLSLGLYAFCPNFLAHAPLATSDVTMAFALLGATGAFWRHTRTLTWKSGILSILATALTCVAKFSFVLLVPIYALLIIVRTVADEPIMLTAGTTRALRTRRNKLLVFALSGVAHALGALAVIWVFHGLRFSAAAPGTPPQAEFYIPWEIITPEHGLGHFAFEFARRLHLAPEAFLVGFAHVLHLATQRGAFMNGEYSLAGWRTFFPYAFLVKTTWSQLATFALAAWVVAALGLRSAPGQRWAWLRPQLYRVAPLLVLFVIYWLFSIGSHLNIGLRHILPTYPILFILAGLVLRPAAPRLLHAAALVLLLGNALESTRIRPHYLAYFNGFAGGPANGWRHLVDSSLDWGQELPQLAGWLQRHRQPKEPVFLSYFGTGEPSYEGIRATELAPYYHFDRDYPWPSLGPGLYCLSATLLQDVYSGWRGPWTLEKERSYLMLRKILSQPLAANATSDQVHLRAEQVSHLDRLRFARLCHYLRLRRPDARIGYSIFVFRLTADEVAAAATGTMAELADAMARALKTKESLPETPIEQ
jgi:hypothetical protein